MSQKQLLKVAKERIASIRKAMKKDGVDAIVINDLAAQRYLFGFSGSTAKTILGKKKIHFITNDLYAVQVKKELHALEDLTVHIDRDPWGIVATKGLLKGATSLGFVPSQCTVSEFKLMKRASKSVRLVEIGDLTSDATLAKSKSEIALIAKAAQITSTAYEKMLGMVKPGMTEHQVATFLAATTRELGSEKDAFDIIVVSGKRSAMPHGRATHSKISKGDVVTVDFGCCIEGMYSDMTRTFCVGTPSQKVVDVFAVLFDAHMSALDAVRAGMTGSDLDAVARNIITKAGYGENFKHSLGHGLGYVVHELPRVSYANTKETIPENCVITIEPGIYIPGKFGMRIEDDVVVGKKGCEILTTAPRELVVV